MVTASDVVVVKRGSGVSMTEHTASVGRSSITRGASTEIVPVTSYGVTVKPPIQLTVTVKSSSSRSTPAGTPSSTLVTVSDPVSRVFANAAPTTAAESVSTVCGLADVVVHDVGDASVIVQLVPGGRSGASGLAQFPVWPEVLIVTVPL